MRTHFWVTMKYKYHGPRRERNKKRPNLSKEKKSFLCQTLIRKKRKIIILCANFIQAYILWQQSIKKGYEHKKKHFFIHYLYILTTPHRPIHYSSEKKCNSTLVSSPKGFLVPREKLNDREGQPAYTYIMVIQNLRPSIFIKKPYIETLSNWSLR